MMELKLIFHRCIGLCLLSSLLMACGSPQTSTNENNTTLPTVSPVATVIFPSPVESATRPDAITMPPIIGQVIVEGTIKQILASNDQEVRVTLNNDYYQLPVELMLKLGTSFQVGNQLRLTGIELSNNTIVWRTAAVFVKPTQKPNEKNNDKDDKDDKDKGKDKNK